MYSIFAIFFTLLMSMDGLFAQEKSWETYQAELEKFWKIQTQFLSNQGFENEQLFGQMLNLKESYGIEKIPTLSQTLLEKIPPLHHMIDKQKHVFFEMAKNISPNDYRNDYYLCDFRMDYREWSTSLRYCLSAFWKETKEPMGTLIYATKLGHRVYWSIVVTVFILIFFFLYKYGPFLVQFYSSYFYWISPLGFLFLTLSFFLLLKLSLGWLFCFSLLFILLWRFLGKNEKILLVFALMGIALLPATIIAPTMAIRFQESVLADVFEFDGSVRPYQVYMRLSDEVLYNPTNAFAAFGLGLMEKKIGNLEKARSLFAAAVESEPNLISARMNLANTEYALGLTQDAITDYKTIIAQEPNLVGAYLNLALIYHRQSNFAETKNILEQVQRMDNDVYENTKKTLAFQLPGDTKLIDFQLSNMEVFRHLARQDKIFQKIYSQTFHTYFPKYDPKQFFLILVFTFLASLLFQLFTHTRNYFALYETREKNQESANFVHLKDFPKAYRSFVRKVEIREGFRKYVNLTLPGAIFFDEGKVLAGAAVLWLFLFLLTSAITFFQFRPTHSDLPWGHLYIGLSFIIYLSNSIFAGIRNGQKKN